MLDSISHSPRVWDKNIILYPSTLSLFIIFLHVFILIKKYNIVRKNPSFSSKNRKVKFYLWIWFFWSTLKFHPRFLSTNPREPSLPRKCIGIKVTKTELVVEPTNPKNRNRTKTGKKTGSQNRSTKTTKIFKFRKIIYTMWIQTIIHKFAKSSLVMCHTKHISLQPSPLNQLLN